MSQLDAAQLLAKAAPLTIPALLDRNARQWPDLPAISMVGQPGSTMTWAAVHERVAQLAAGFAAEGVRPGEVVLIMMSSRPEHWLVDLALVHLGAIPSTVYATLSPDQLRYLA